MAIVFTGDEGGPISLSQARQWTQNYRTDEQTRVTTVIQAHFFGKNKILDILNQPDCVGIRVYHAVDDLGNRRVVLVGAKEDGTNIVNSLVNENDPNPSLLDFSQFCPPICNPPNGDI